MNSHSARQAVSWQSSIAVALCNYRNAAVLIQPELLNMYAQDEPQYGLTQGGKGQETFFKERLDFRGPQF